MLLAAGTLTASSGCATAMPAWHGKIWKADHRTASVVRTQAHESIAATDPRFSDGYWLERKDFLSFAETLVLSCKEWDQEIPLVSLDDFKKLINALRGIK
jgi:hypothetical protein